MEFTAKTVEEAVNEALKTLGAERENVTVEVKEEPVKGLFGRLKGKAVVEVNVIETPKEEKKEEAGCAESGEKTLEFVKELLGLMGIEAECRLTENDGNTVITLNSDDSSALIGRRGEILDAVQTLAGAVLNIGNKVYKKVVVDCENYRDKREETLVRLAHKLEEKATDMRREVILEPMSPFERRIIHTALSESKTVTTRSDGKEPNRYVVIVPNDKDENARPYNAARNARGGRDHGRDRRDRGGRNGGRNNRGGMRGGNGRRSGFTEEKRKPSGFGTYLGNSLKDNK